MGRVLTLVSCSFKKGFRIGGTSYLFFCHNVTILYIYLSSSFGAKLVMYSESGGVKLKSVQENVISNIGVCYTFSAQHGTVFSRRFALHRCGGSGSAPSPRIFPRMANVPPFARLHQSNIFESMMPIYPSWDDGMMRVC